MQLIRFTIAAACSVSVLVSSAQGQQSTATGSYALQFLKFDRNGNGKLDPAERAAMNAKPAPAEQPIAGLPLICEGESIGDGGGGGGSSASQTETQHHQHEHAAFQRQAQWRVVRHPLPQPADEPQPNQQLPEGAEDDAAHGYQVEAPSPAPPTPVPPPSVGLSKAVQYRLLANRDRQRPRPTQYRQAAVFGATIGLTKRQPSRYLPIQCVCCNSRRSSLFIGY